MGENYLLIESPKKGYGEKRAPCLGGQKKPLPCPFKKEKKLIKRGASTSVSCAGTSHAENAYEEN